MAVNSIMISKKSNVPGINGVNCSVSIVDRNKALIIKLLTSILFESRRITARHDSNENAQQQSER